jgi:hypothetical protein
MLNLFRRKPDIPALRAAREAARVRYVKAGKGDRTEAYLALVRATHRLMEAENKCLK